MKELVANSSLELDQLIVAETIASNIIVLLFTGSKNENGKSWCPDCVVAEPVIESVLQQLRSNDCLVFITVPVGDRSM